MVHNGTIRDTFNLCKKYEIDDKGLNVDSQKLYTIIANKGLDVLNNYEGAAALVWTDVNNPNIMYAYHGKSKEYKTGPEKEERPLFFMCADEGVYFSSLENSLLAIREKEEDEIAPLNHNFVWKIEDGEIKESIYKVDRGDSNCPFVYSGSTSKTIAIVGPEFSLVERETIPIRVTRYKNQGIEDFVYFHKNRYYKGDGSLCDGPLYLNKKGIITKSLLGGVKEYFFWEGVLLKDLKSYNIIVSDYTNNKYSYLNDPAMNFALRISKHTDYPITNIGDQGSGLASNYRYKYYKNEVSVKGKDSFTAKFSQRNYTLENSYLTDIKPSLKEDSTIFEAAKEKTAEKVEVKNTTIPLTVTNSVFDQVYLTLKEASESLDENDYLALMHYIENTKETPLEMETEELRMAAWDTLRKAVEKKETIANILGDTHKELERISIIIQTLNKNELENNMPEELNEEPKEEEVDTSDLEDTIEIVKELIGRGEELELNKDSFIQDCGQSIKKSLENLKHDLSEICETYKKNNLISQLEKL